MAPNPILTLDAKINSYRNFPSQVAALKSIGNSIKMLLPNSSCSFLGGIPGPNTQSSYYRSVSDALPMHDFESFQKVSPVRQEHPQTRCI